MNIASVSFENEKEQKVHAAVSAALEPGESLLDYTLGRATLGGQFPDVHIGLTNRRMLIYRTRKPQEVFSVYPQYIKEMSLSKSILWSNSRGLKLSFQNESLILSTPKKPWFQRAQGMVELYNQMPPAAATLSNDQIVQQVRDLNSLGLLLTAESALKDAMQADPIARTDPAMIDTLGSLREGKLALQVGAGIFAMVLLFILFLAALGFARLSPLGIIITLLCTYNLWRARLTWRTAGVLLGLVQAFINIIYNLASPLDLVMWLSFGVAVIVVLTGKPTRARTLIGAGIFAVGFIGVFLSALVVGVLRSL